MNSSSPPYSSPQQQQQPQGQHQRPQSTEQSHPAPSPHSALYYPPFAQRDTSFASDRDILQDWQNRHHSSSPSAPPPPPVPRNNNNSDQVGYTRTPPPPTTIGTSETLPSLARDFAREPAVVADAPAWKIRQLFDHNTNGVASPTSNPTFASASGPATSITTTDIGGAVEATTPSSAGRKRSASPSYPLDDNTNNNNDDHHHHHPSYHQSTESLAKRRRLRPRSNHFLDTFSLPGPPLPDINEATSPLFFSNTPRLRPSLPPRFSSSEAAAKMLSKARGEESHVKTVSLARGVVSSSSSAPSSYTSQPPLPGTQITPTSAPLFQQQPQSRKSSERNFGPAAVPAAGSSSPESSSAGSNVVSPMLNSIGIVELLEQDERPTFVVDLSDGMNYGPGPLHITFANSSLRSYVGLEGLVSGMSIEEKSSSTTSSSGPHSHLQFKSWLLSASVNGESLNVCLPSFIYGGMSWSCSTLRKRLRIISGSFMVTPDPTKTHLRSLRLSATPSSNPDPNTQDSSHIMATAEVEAPDYFGTAAAGGTTTTTRLPRSIPTSNGSSMLHEAVATIENPPSVGATSAGSGNVHNAGNASAITSEAGENSIVLQSTPGGPEGPSPHDVPNIDVSTPMSSSNNGPNGEEDSYLRSSLTSPMSASFDWTRLPVSDSMPEHIRFARSIDWDNTPLGPIENWSSDLRQMCNLIMASPHPAAMYWGEDDVAIYNEAYILLAGQKHPQLMGTAYSVAWAEIWEEVKEAFASAKMTGEATMKDDDCLFIKRSDSLEETYFSWSIIPLVGQDGQVMGLYNPVFEKTRRKIAERRMLTLRELGERTSSARDVKSFWAQVLGAFEYNEFDSPFLMLYSVTDEADSDSSSIHSNSVFASRQCLLEGSLGVPEGHPAAPRQIDLKAGVEGFGPVFREITKTDKPVLLEVGSRDLPERLVQGLEWRGFGDAVRAVVACPIHPTTGENILGFLVLGVNPRRPYDDDYSLFVQLLSRQLATSLASVVLFEEEIRRGQRAAKLAALDRIELSEQLAARTQEAIDSETRFTRMAEFAPVGMFIADKDGQITFANDTWYDISRVPKGSAMADTWMDSVKPEDHDLVKRLWQKLTVSAEPVCEEFRFKAQWKDRNGNMGETWVLFSGYPEKYQDGRLKSVFGSITNISQQKWAEGIQTRKMEEAVELKRQQENFIDITSHEMRNPLSAILQCSDEIATTLTRFKQSDDKTMTDEMVTSCLDAAQIISLCSQHQKRIVDDVLTLSKLDSQLLLVTPVDAQPLTVVQRALKMHEGELQAADIQMKFVVDQSYRDMELDWVRLDPSRVMQVLINLTTNAIKFTGSESRRTITVTISASRDRPSELADAPVKYFPTRNKRREIMEQKEWGDGEKVHILFSVKDTGRGLNTEEKKLLFMRFSQASPRTHVQYGGSGLGLFISRELTELQGGEIGVESEAGKGSTFAFYIVARKIPAPVDADGALGVSRSSSIAQQQDSSTSATSNNIKSKLLSPTAVRKAMPGAEADAQASQQPTTKPSPGPTQKTSPQPKSPPPRRVLIVEDNLVNQRVLQKQLRNIGTETHLANHGGEALEKLRQSTYWARDDSPAPSANGKDDGGGTTPPLLQLGVVLMDQEMPVMDGLTCTRRIRALEREGRIRAHVPIIAVTANARAEQVQTALDAGMDDVVSKPFRIPDLVPKIEELMAKYPAPGLDDK